MSADHGRPGRARTPEAPGSREYRRRPAPPPSGSRLADDVLDLVDLVPSGRATTYGDLAELLGTGPRQTAAVLSRDGGATVWWRVVRADGSLPQALTAQALTHWRAEGTPTRERAGGVVVDLARARWAGPACPD